MPKTKKPISERFWEKVKKTDGCWIWTRAVMAVTGYGCFGGKPNKLAHRVAWELTHGPIPIGLCVLHRCDNRLCCNPDHLFLGTHKDNTDDMMNKGRQRNALGSDCGSSKLTKQQVHDIKEIHSSGAMGYRKLAKLYRVHYVTIGDIIRGATWKHI